MVEIRLIRFNTGIIAIGVATPFGFMPVMSFPDMESLENFGMGIVGYCEHLKIPIPQVFLDAFKEEDNGSGNQHSQDKPDNNRPSQ